MNHSFVVVGDDRQLYAFGQNTKGQLGIGNIKDTHIPTKVGGEVMNKSVIMACGGDHHSLVLTSEGRVYSFGANDEGQLGLGDTCGEFL